MKNEQNIQYKETKRKPTSLPKCKAEV